MIALILMMTMVVVPLPALMAGGCVRVAKPFHVGREQRLDIGREGCRNIFPAPAGFVQGGGGICDIAVIRWVAL
jgi:hypothetical protein